MTNQTDVLILGAGPVGLTLAAELTRHGVAPAAMRLIECRAGLTPHSNALIVHARTQEVLDAMGAYAPFAQAGFPADLAALHAFGRPAAELRLGGVDSPHPAPLILPQHETERFLQAHLESLGGRVEHSVEAVRVEPDADGATVTLRHGADGPLETVRTRWLVGCEGSRSLTREANGISFEGARYAGEEFLMGDFTLRWGRPAGRITVFVEDGRTLMVFPFDGRNEFTRVLCARRDEDPGNQEPPTLAELESIVREVAGDPGATLTNERWRTRWRSGHRLADRFRAGRCLIAGDAGHVHVPAGGQGMNYGIQDAFNLGWKLAAVARGRAPESLLDTYADERHATAAQLVAGTDRAYHAAIKPGPVASFALRHLAPVLAPLEAVQAHVRTLMSEFNVAYPGSALTEDHGGHGGPRAGQRAPNAPVSLGARRAPGQLFGDVLRGTHWTLLLFSGGRPGADACRRLAEAGRAAAGMGAEVCARLVFAAPVPNFEASDDALLDFSGGLHARYGVGKNPALCLIRPDWYIGFSGGVNDTERLRAYVRRTADTSLPA